MRGYGIHRVSECDPAKRNINSNLVTRSPNLSSMNYDCVDLTETLKCCWVTQKIGTCAVSSLWTEGLYTMQKTVLTS